MENIGLSAVLKVTIKFGLPAKLLIINFLVSDGRVQYIHGSVCQVHSIMHWFTPRCHFNYGIDTYTGCNFSLWRRKIV